MNPYKVLGIRKNASEATIKKAYRKLSMKHHPDKGGDAEVMAEITAAYAILSNAKRKADYDTTGNTSDKPSLQAQAVGALCNCLEARMSSVREMNSYTDLINEMRGYVKQAQRGGKNELREAKKLRKHATEIMDRLKSKTGNNIFTRQLIDRIAQAELKMENAITQVRVLLRAYRMLNDYEFKNTEISGILETAYEKNNPFSSQWRDRI